MTRKDEVGEARRIAERLGYRVVYVHHEVIEDHNATYNVIYRGKVITTNASKAIGVPINEIWISEMWKPYERYILFHEIKEIEHKAAGLTPREAHKRAMNDAPPKWRSDPLFQKMIREIREMDRRTRKKKAASKQSTTNRS